MENLRLYFWPPYFEHFFFHLTGGDCDVLWEKWWGEGG